MNEGQYIATVKSLGGSTRITYEPYNEKPRAPVIGHATATRMVLQYMKDAEKERIWFTGIHSVVNRHREIGIRRLEALNVMRDLMASGDVVREINPSMGKAGGSKTRLRVTC